MESKPALNGLSLEQMVIAVGSFLYNNEDATICDIDGLFLKDLKLIIEAELERREAQLH